MVESVWGKNKKIKRKCLRLEADSSAWGGTLGDVKSDNLVVIAIKEN